MRSTAIRALRFPEGESHLDLAAPATPIAKRPDSGRGRGTPDRSDEEASGPKSGVWLQASRGSQVPLRNSSLATYIRMVTQCAKLSRAHEEELTTAWYQHQDKKARDELVRAHLRHAVSLGLKYRRFGVPLAELIAEGNAGIVHALTKFEPARGFRFVTYASYWIRAYMLDYVLRSWSLVGAGSGALRSRTFFVLKREKARLVGLHGEGLQADTLLAEKFGVSVDRVRAMLERLSTRDLSLDDEVHADSPTTQLDNLTSDLNQENQLGDLEFRQVQHRALRAALETLQPRERFIIEQRLMADDATQVSLAEVGRHLGLSAERTRQLEIRAKRKLRVRVTLACREHTAERASARAAVQ